MEFDKELKVFYNKLANEFRPKRIKTLFVGESFPIGGAYFYWPKSISGPLGKSVFRKSLGKIPKDNGQYLSFLKKLKGKGVFVIDIYENPLRVGRNDERELIKRLIEEKMFHRIRNLNPKRVYFILPKRNQKYERAINQLITRLKNELSIKGKREKSPWIKR